MQLYSAQGKARSRKNAIEPTVSLTTRQKCSSEERILRCAGMRLIYNQKDG